MINIKSDSRNIKAGDTFVAIKGATVDGHEFIDDAIKNGATKIIAERGSYSVETEIVKDTKEYLTNFMATNYQGLLEGIKFIGITGTNGKTTTAYVVYQMLKELGKKSAYIGTIGFFIDGEFIKEVPNTTMEITATYSLIEEAKNKGATVIVMEVSSHSLEEKRLEGISFDVGGFTNLTQDHLDYHETMEKYLNAKLKLLGKLKENGKMVVNADDESHSKFLSPKTVTMGNNGIEYKFNNYSFKQGKTDINFNFNGQEYKVQTNFTGEFNVYNFMMAIAIVKELRFKIKDILNIAKSIYPPKGRCEIILAKGAQIIIDYAHTPDAMEKIINCFKNMNHNRIITIIGCGGDRDPIKRPIMGRIASENSDYVIFTNDNPRTEDEQKIMNDILKGVNSNNYEVIYDRKKAIEKAISLISFDDILLILGKGHENYQIIGKEKIHCDDSEIVLNLVNKD